MTRRTILVVLAFAGLTLIVLDRGAAREPERPGTLVARLLGPVRGLAATVQWVRFNEERTHGRFDLAYEHAESALELDPRAPAGWMVLAHHLAFDRGAPGMAPDDASRLFWFEAGLAVLERGREQVADPADLWFLRGTFLAAQAEYEAEDCVWPGGPGAALLEAAAAFEAGGDPEVARRLRERAAEWTSLPK